MYDGSNALQKCMMAAMLFKNVWWQQCSLKMYEVNMILHKLRGAPFNMMSLLFGHCPFGGGGVNACPNGLGQLFREVQTGICLILGGSKPLPRWFGALMQWKLKLKWAFACVKEGVKACQDALCTYVPSKWWFGKFAQIGPEKKCPGVPVWVRGGGCNRYLGNAQIEVTSY